MALPAWLGKFFGFFVSPQAKQVEEGVLDAAEAHPQIVGAAVTAVTKNPQAGKLTTEALEAAAAVKPAK